MAVMTTIERVRLRQMFRQAILRSISADQGFRFSAGQVVRKSVVKRTVLVGDEGYEHAPLLIQLRKQLVNELRRDLWEFALNDHSLGL
jgi:hypothetical protein